MSTPDLPPDDRLLGSLRDLATAAPPDLTDAVVDRWVRAPGPFDDVYAAVGGKGIRFVRTAGHVGGDPQRFAAEYRARFPRPLVAGDDPTPLREALAAPGPDVVVDLSGLSPFEAAVLTVVRGIPVGETRPYAWVAREAGRPAAVRATGTVLARNPVPLLIPCHRVTRSDGALGQYMFGPAHKELLLRREHTALDRAGLATARGHQVVGNPATGTFCLPTCHELPADDRELPGFRRPDDARAAGFTPCPACRPVAA